MANHLRIAAIMRFIYGSLGLSAALLCFFFGALLFDASSWGRFLSTLFFVATIAIGFNSALGLIAAYGMLERRPWGRVLGIIVAVIELPGFPFYTAMGGYTLWVLLQPGAAKLFKAPASAPAPLPPRDLTWR